MVNWTSLIIIGAVILVAVFFVLPALSGSGSSGSGNISGGMPTNPSGDLGQGGTTGDVYNISYVPPATAGVNSPSAPQGESIFSYGDVNNPSQYAAFSGTGSGRLTFIGKDLLGTAGITREQLQAAGYQESKAFSGYFAPESAGGGVIAQGKNESLIIEGNGKSTTHVLSGGTYGGSSGGFNSQGKGTYKTPNPANIVGHEPVSLPSISKGKSPSTSRGFGGGGAGAR